MKSTILFIVSFLICNLIIYGQDLPIPKNYVIKDTVTGDLDSDGIKELVVVYNTKPESEDDNESIPRALIIYKKEKQAWNTWKKSEQAVYGSKDGGMMGDPYGNIEIQKGILLISQNSGSSWHWSATDKYRFQNGEFYLIGYTCILGKVCGYSEIVDFNLVTGKLAIKKEYESCDEAMKQKIDKQENEEFYEKDLKITLQNRNEKEIKIVSPKYAHEIYVAKKLP